ncbi:(Fe-S)-binding protein [Desulforhopalus singaporensis]|uniref:Fe-S oxidoreductase n=1 Tax=Desulforhopalus singaporensis TaxID=91360 RepID=A0A1H0KBT0_9BACT|nr:(Fe-S)-binding protein [Desulforhopalus singaporensis]SDO53299.1 Fe-S oxidoreductase [Desulforhopalus singaporensis]
MSPLISPAEFSVLGLPLRVVSILIPLGGIALFAYMVKRRLVPLRAAMVDERKDHPGQRWENFLSLWLAQSRQLRYKTAGAVHLVIFFGFLILSIRAVSLVFIGIDEGFGLPGFSGGFGAVYNIVKDLAATAVLAACAVALYRRVVVKPERYRVPEGKGKDHSKEAVLVLTLIALLMVSEAAFEAAMVAAGEPQFLLPFTLVWLLVKVFAGFSPESLQTIHVLSYFTHDIVFFSFLCYLPLGKHFHVVTSMFNVWCWRLKKGTVKPVQYGVSGEELFDLESVGVKKLEDFTWKHMLDFYSCADCGRCSDNCPANSVGRPLSPRFLTVKGRDRLFDSYPLTGDIKPSDDLVGTTYKEDEIWSCTTCGACEEECPIGIEYIDKIVDLRRGMVDEGMVPQSLQAPLKALEKRGNPYGKMEKKRAVWAKDEEFAAQCDVKILEKEGTADTLYFVDSITSYEDRMQEIARATSRILQAAGIDFGILGKKEKDSGNDVRRFGEEMLFQDLKDQNREAIAGCGAKNIVTADPHAMNALKNEYEDIPPASHISQLALKEVKSGRLQLKPVADPTKIYTYHDPCYLGRHNEVYLEPRELIDSIPGIKRVEMARNQDRSFCCGGGGLMLYYEPEEETRMGIVRVQMAKDIGANVIVTACPFCLVNIQDAVKTLNLDSEIEVIDIAELVAKQLEQTVDHLEPAAAEA